VTPGVMSRFNPEGTTATLSLSSLAGSESYVIVVFAIYGTKKAVLDTANPSSVTAPGPVSLDCDVEQDSVGFGGVGQTQSPATGFSWTGATEVTDQNNGSNSRVG